MPRRRIRRIVERFVHLEPDTRIMAAIEELMTATMERSQAVLTSNDSYVSRPSRFTETGTSTTGQSARIIRRLAMPYSDSSMNRTLATRRAGHIHSARACILSKRPARRRQTIFTPRPSQLDLHISLSEIVATSTVPINGVMNQAVRRTRYRQLQREPTSTPMVN